MDMISLHTAAGKLDCFKISRRAGDYPDVYLTEAEVSQIAVAWADRRSKQHAPKPAKKAPKKEPATDEK